MVYQSASQEKSTEISRYYKRKRIPHSALDTCWKAGGKYGGVVLPSVEMLALVLMWLETHNRQISLSLKSLPSADSRNKKSSHS